MADDMTGSKNVVKTADELAELARDVLRSIGSGISCVHRALKPGRAINECCKGSSIRRITFTTIAAPALPHPVE